MHVKPLEKWSFWAFWWFMPIEPQENGHFWPVFSKMSHFLEAIKE